MWEFSGLKIDPVWESVGLAGQLIFGSRFLYQWFASERAKKSVIPLGFWWLSIAGTLLIFAYAIHKQSPAFMLPTLTGLPVYVRNLILIRRERALGAG